MAKVLNKDKFGKEVSLDVMLRLFKKQVEKDDIIYEIKRRQHYLPPRLAKKEKQAHLRKVTKFKK